MRVRDLVVLPILLLAACPAAAPPAEAPPREYKKPVSNVDTCRLQKPSVCTGPPPSYARDVSPILQKRCLACHANNGMAADDHDFSRFATLQAQRSQVVTQVGGCGMPPTQPLQAEEADVLLKWAICGAPQN